MWKYTKEKYNIPDAAQAWALKAIQSAWRKYKNWLKNKHYVPYANDELRMENRPGYVPQSHFMDLLVYWNSEKSQKMSNTNTENRKKLRYPHTVGKKSFAVIREGRNGKNRNSRKRRWKSIADAFAAQGPRSSGPRKIQKMEEMEARMQKMQEKFDAQTEVMEQDSIFVRGDKLLVVTTKVSNSSSSSSTVLSVQDISFLLVLCLKKLSNLDSYM
ncbi:uncharacterized protein LOC132057749 [Lycium ferocissimum]|uniref:uncharacterized protein LOC132057749 n=1 Tax=Lycium ferocissimum TaxID=112874 RepID=UPI00281568B1|nr:uncharacterized protein LOC132057749 [Lycium ferocissimum]